MEQLSRPYQIALGALLVFALAWFTVLKPGGDESSAAVPPPAATPAVATPNAAAAVPGATGLGAAVDKANGAAAAAGANAAATQQAVAALGSGPAAPVADQGAPGGTAKAAVAEASAEKTPPADPSAPILRDVADGKVAVLLFFSPRADDDRAVRRALVRADRHRGKVVVRAASIARVADYAAITDGVDVLQAPTLLVIGRDLRARTIVGFTDTKAIDQLVSDVGGPAFAPRRVRGYAGRIANLCAVASQSLAGTALNGDDLEARFTLLRADVTDALRAARHLDPPRRYARFHRLLEENLELGQAMIGDVVATLRKGGDPTPGFVAAMQGVVAADAKVDAAAKKAGLRVSC